MKQRLLLIPLLLLALSAPAAAADPLKDGGEHYSLPADKPLLLVVHGNAVFDKNQAAKSGIDAAVAKAKSFGWPIVYLTYPGTPNYIAQPASVEIGSQKGEHKLKIESSRIYVAGGFATRCAFRGLLDAIGSADSPKITAYLIADAMYTDGEANKAESMSVGALSTDSLMSMLKTMFTIGYNEQYRLKYPNEGSQPTVELFFSGAHRDTLAKGKGKAVDLYVIRTGEMSN
jgi:hypothetical protein